MSTLTPCDPDPSRVGSHPRHLGVDPECRIERAPRCSGSTHTSRGRDPTTLRACPHGAVGRPTRAGDEIPRRCEPVPTVQWVDPYEPRRRSHEAATLSPRCSGSTPTSWGRAPTKLRPSPHGAVGRPRRAGEEIPRAATQSPRCSRSTPTSWGGDPTRLRPSPHGAVGRPPRAGDGPTGAGEMVPRCSRSTPTRWGRTHRRRGNGPEVQ